MKLKNVLIFVVGVVSGSCVTAYYTRKYFQLKLDEEIEAAKNLYSVTMLKERVNDAAKFYEELEEAKKKELGLGKEDLFQARHAMDEESSVYSEEEEVEDNTVPVSKSSIDMDKYKNMIEVVNHFDYRKGEAPPETMPSDYIKKDPESIAKDILNEVPYTIDKVDFGMIEEYETQQYVLFDDDYVVDEENEVLENYQVESLFGDLIDEFSESEYQVMYIRNDKQETDFEIIKDPRSWEEVMEEMDELNAERY